ncbi:hypothetical protein AVEN_255624-1 [Araneus ventricosus]|uniref:Uncharacterized protein n=1 Tax=Araneus ventricosus TaxID=182803 RepID=A0A4Y2W2J4_ARAVE|nr:hypothetical protein AVEN_255624-1 [Araneus ventricosus]
MTGSIDESCLKSMTGDHCPAHLACRSGDQDEAPRPPPAPGSPPLSIRGVGLSDVFYDGTEDELPSVLQYGEQLSLPEVLVRLLVPRSCLKSMTGDHCPAHLACRSGDQDEAPRPPPSPGSPPHSNSGFRIADVFYSTIPLVGHKYSQL